MLIYFHVLVASTLGKGKKGGLLTAQQEFSLDFIHGSGLIVVIAHTDIDKLYLSCLRTCLV